jgi:hypothetical protein
MRLLLRFLAVLFMFGVPLSADEPHPIELTIAGRAIETPVLKYRLIPPESEMKPGNAVPILLRLPWDQRLWMTQIFPTLHEWGTRPLNAPEWAQSQGVLPESFYIEMRRAAFRREASWEYPLGEVSTPYRIFLPDVQELSNWLGKGSSARIRYHISRGEFDKAREGIMVGIANSRHIAHTTFDINQLVAIAIHRIMLERVNVSAIQRHMPPGTRGPANRRPDVGRHPRSGRLSAGRPPAVPGHLPAGSGGPSSRSARRIALAVSRSCRSCWRYTRIASG